MKEMKRILALVLCFVMLVGMMPAIALNADAATGDVIDAAIFCSDVHGSSSSVSSAFTGIKNTDSSFNPSTATFVGDTQMAASSVTSAAQSVYSGVACYYAYGNHDNEGSYGISDVTGLLYGDSTTNYYIYAISQTSMASSNPDTSGFTSTVAGLDKNKPLFIASHLPLHSRRGDSNGAAAWYEAIHAAAEQMDIVFFWAHNHTGEDDVDRAAFYVAKDGDETFTLENTATKVTPNFTYMNAGFVGKSSSRGGVVSTVKIYSDALVFQDYNSTGTFTGEYSHNVEVAREFAGTTDSGEGGSTTPTTDPGEGETTTETKEVYVLVDTLTNNGEYLIVNTNAAGDGYAMNHSSGTEGAVAVSIQESGDYIYIDLDDSTAVWTATTKSSGFELMNGSYYLEAYGSSSAIEISTTQEYSARYWTYDSSSNDLSYDGGTGDHSIQYADSAFSSTKNGAVIYIYEKQTITVSSDGTVSGGGSTEGGDAGDSGDSGNTGGSTETVVGTGTYTTADDGSYQTVTFGSTTTEKKTVYVLTNSITSGTSYLIVNGNSAGSYYALANNSSSVAATGVTVKTDSEIGTYIELTDATDELWTASGSRSTTLKNGSYYLTYSGSKGNYSLDLSTSSSSWTYSSNRLSIVPNRTTYYVVYDSGWDMSSSSDNVYFYVPTEVDMTTDSSVTYAVTASDIEHFYTADETDTETEKITASVTEGAPEGTYSYEILSDEDSIISSDIASDGTITFSGAEGTAQVKVSYSWTEGEGDEAVTYTIWQVIDVTATAPYYKVELHKKNDDGTLELIEAPIALKGVEANDTYSVWAVVKYYDGIIEDGEDGKDLGDLEDDSLYWVVSDPSIATIDPATGVITFTGENYGTFDVTVYYRDADGKILCADTITISATESQYVVPGDGTDDFPEYPDQGAIRFDKTAVAQGNFSQSGIAKVELSMTGVPYGTNVKTDVVIMVDMTASMSDDDVTAAEAAVKELIESLVYDEENDKYDSNIQLFIDVFYSASSDSAFSTEEYMAGTTISSAAELTAAKALIDFTQSSQGGGTRYNLAMKDVYETLNRDGHADNQFVVFVSDGVPTAYAPLTNGTLGTTITGDNSTTSSLAAGWFDSEGEVTDEFETEYYSYLIKTAGIPVYTVGANLTALSDASDLINHMSSNYSPDGKTSTGETKYSFTCTTSGGITDTVLEIFRGIGADIKEAATNVVVEDKIDSHYTMNFSLPENVTAAEAGNMDDFYIQVLGYELDENNDRKADHTVLEKFLFNSDGTITHTIGSTTCGSCTHVTKTGDKITGIDGTYFDYTVDANGDEFLTWTAEKLDRTELTLEYFVYLDHSAGEEAADQVAPGTYPTNEYATITYTNFNGKECQQKFPVPTMTWMGAKVTYVFYLVNEDGQPVNRAGKVIPFAEAIFVTDPVTYDVTWNEEAGIEKLDAAYLAQDKVPEVYQLYDNQAYYEILVYQTEGVDKETSAVNYNHFIIEGSSSVANKETTKVYNTKAGDRFDDYGAYSATAGSYTSTKSGTSYTATVTTDIDYANTTVAFAVVWKPELVPDTVVVDYGLDVVIDVTTNDTMSAGVTGVSTTAPANVEPNSGTYKTSAMGTSTNILIDDLIIGTAKVENLNAVRFTLNKTSGMQFNEPVEFFYESECNYYTYDTAGNRTLNTAFMYSSVTVIPATTIYYEDEYVTLKTYELDSKDTDGDGDTAEYIETAGWDTSSLKASATQAQDRPGESKISADLDADNNYGYDAAYSAMSTYSMNRAAMVNVKEGKYATAQFSFYGTGFDIISLTDTTTGTIFVKVEDADGNSVKNVMVDTYYGYKMIKNEDGTISWETTTSNDPNALYQVPVIKVENLGYGKYTVTITASYVASFDNVADSTSYDFYLDAIRIYDPTGNENNVANDAYVKDGEGWPTYEEVRNNIIDAKTFESMDTGAVNGIVFIDSNAANASVADYTSYGPNNELYLAPGQAINFTLTPGSNVAKVQMALKTVINSADVKIYTVVDGKEDKVLLDQNITTATDMYYTLWETIKDANGNYTQASEMNLVIMNDGTSGVLSITNVKTTYTSDPSAAAAPAMFMLRRASVDDALATLNVEEEVPETTVPEETEPETTVPETTEPETTVPEETEPETTVPEESEPETTVPEETEPEETKPGHQEQAEQVIRKVVKIIKGFLDWIFG